MQNKKAARPAIEKRALCMRLAMSQVDRVKGLGQAQVVVLQEPTSAMPSAAAVA
jgi:hypothetical protein